MLVMDDNTEEGSTIGINESHAPKSVNRFTVHVAIRPGALNLRLGIKLLQRVHLHSLVLPDVEK